MDSVTTPTPTRRDALVSLAALAGAMLLGPTASGTGRDLIKWRPLDVGEAEAKKSGKPVMYFLTAEWCGPCHTMRSAIFNDPAVAELIHKEFIPVEVVDRQREEGRNAQAVNDVFIRFKLRGFPTLAVARPTAGISLVNAGWSRKESIVKFLSEARSQLVEREKQRESEKKASGA